MSNSELHEHTCLALGRSDFVAMKTQGMSSDSWLSTVCWRKRNNGCQSKDNLRPNTSVN